MSLHDLQALHVKLTAQLIAWAYAQGYEITWGETLRTKEQAEANAKSGIGVKNSLHLIKLAVDLSLFKDGVFLIHRDDYAPLGAYWKSLNPLCRWGGDFSKPDSDHFSITYNGVQ